MDTNADFKQNQERNFDDRLLKLLEKEVLREKWKEKIKIIGLVTKKRLSKKGSFVITVKTKKFEYDFVVLEYKKDEFELAKKINYGDTVKVIGYKHVSGIIFSDVIIKLNKEKINSKQIKLIN